jgi:hypothetical protein
VNRWFDGHHPQREGWFLGTLVEALLRRTTTFDDVEGEAMAIAEAVDSCPRQGCIRTLLPRAFPMGSRPSPAAIRFWEALNNPARNTAGRRAMLETCGWALGGVPSQGIRIRESSRPARERGWGRYACAHRSHRH